MSGQTREESSARLAEDESAPSPVPVSKLPATVPTVASPGTPEPLCGGGAVGFLSSGAATTRVASEGFLDPGLEYLFDDDVSDDEYEALI